MPYRRLPSLLALRAFEAVSRHGSMKNAADELNVTPGAVSQLVKKLEEQLDVKLIKRVSRGFELTEQGIRLKAGLSEAFVHMKQAVDAVLPSEQSNTLIVACDPPFASKWLVPRLSEYLQSCPETDIRIVSSFDKLDSQTTQFDVAILLGNHDLEDMTSEPLGEEHMVVLASPDFIQQQRIREPKDILRVPILSETNSAQTLKTPTWSDWLKATDLPLSNAGRGVNFGAHEEHALDAAVAGAGVVLARKALVSIDCLQERLVCPFGPQLASGLQYQVLTANTVTESEQATAFKAWLKEKMLESLSSASPKY